MCKVPGNSLLACKVYVKTGASFPPSDFLRYDGREQAGTLHPRPTAAALASSERQQASKLLKASIDSFFVLSRNRTSLKSLKSYFHETRRVPCKCREIVALL